VKTKRFSKTKKTEDVKTFRFAMSGWRKRQHARLKRRAECSSVLLCMTLDHFYQQNVETNFWKTTPFVQHFLHYLTWCSKIT